MVKSPVLNGRFGNSNTKTDGKRMEYLMKMYEIHHQFLGSMLKYTKITHVRLHHDGWSPWWAFPDFPDHLPTHPQPPDLPLECTLLTPQMHIP